MIARAAALSVLIACGAKTGANPDALGDDDAPAQTIDAASIPDPCGNMIAACPTPPALARGSGLKALDRCAFPLTDTGTWSDRAALVDAIDASVPRVTLDAILTDLNRAGVTTTAANVPGTAPGIKSAFKWAAGDESVAYWIPQGITGSFDGRDDGLVAGRKVVMVSWYYDIASDTGSTVEKGVRIAIADVTNAAAVAYRFAILVEPVTKNGRTDFAAIPVHAGGLAWVGNYLYVPVTGSGFRVFDLTRILRVDDTTGSADVMGYDATVMKYRAVGYRYAIPQVAEYKDAGTCNAVFSFVSLDRSTTPPSLVSGEYDSASVVGRLYRWPLAADGHLVVTDANRVIPDAAYYMAESHVQGGASRNGTFWLSSSQPSGSAGALYRTHENMPSTTLGWVDSPEDLAFDPQTDRLWCLSEAVNNRVVISVARASVE